MSFLLVGAAAVTVGAGVAKAISGGKQKKKARAEKEAAKAQMELRKKQFSEMDTSNPFKNMENKMEDLTVNQQEAEFTRQTQQQNQANIMANMKGAAGGSGIAALAQTLANQGSLDAQKAAVSIGKQETANQMAERKASAQIQAQEREGEIMSRQMEQNKIGTMMDMEAAEMAAAAAAEGRADAKMWSGISSAAGGVTKAVTGGVV
tara:strand:+ start:16782 stop:17399 length:618 start_codon:yes stop_codon:yes gene_type:complete